MTKENKVEDLLNQVREQELWLSVAGYNAYNVDIAFKSIFKAIENVHISSTSDDCVSRAELKKWLDMNFFFGGALRKLEMFDRIDKELPPVTPIHKVGKWVRKPIRNDKGGCIGAEMICSCCNKDNRHDEYMDYCPNCGADMRGSEE